MEILRNDPRMSRSYEDDEIERALRQLTESRDLLESDIDNQSVNSEWRKEVSTSSRYSYDSRMWKLYVFSMFCIYELR